MNRFKQLCAVAVSILLASILLLPEGIADAGIQIAGAKEATIRELNQRAELLYKYASDGDISAVQQELERIRSLFASGDVQQQLTMEGVHALSGSILDLEQSLRSVQASQEETVRVAASLRLATDTLVHPKNPLWQQYFKILKEDLNAMQTQFSKGSKSGVSTELQSMEEHYATIRTAVVVSGSSAAVVRMDSWMSYMRGVADRQPLDITALQSAMGSGSETLNVLFGREKDASAFASFVPIADSRNAMLAISILLSCALSYAAYRKYNGESPWKPRFRS